MSEFPAYYGGNITDEKEALIREYEERYKRKIPRNYVPLYLSLDDLRKQLDSIVKGKPRPKLKSAEPEAKTSKWTEKAIARFGDGRSKEEMAKELAKGNAEREKQIKEGMDKIYDRGMEAYRTSGSRPLQTPFSWGQARVYSVLFGGPARRQDRDVVKEYKIPRLK
jgi:hypothetical protein